MADDPRVADLVRILAKVAGGDFSEKPEVVDGDDDLARFTLAARFMIDDLEASRAVEAKRRDELEAMNAKLREMAELKSRFINNAAHELNTPLTPIGVQLHMLRGGKLGELSEPQARALDVLARNLERLTFLVTDLLDASRLQSDQLRIERQPTRVDTLLEECARSFAPQARAADVALVVAPAPRPITATVDPRRITQVAFNLLSNALKFTPPGGSVEVSTTLAPGMAVVRVKDSGAGLTREQVERLFQPFSQVHDTMRATRAGTGLGLYISRGIVEQHGGQIWVESEGHGRGASFAFTLPLTDVATMVAHAAPPSLVPTRPFLSVAGAATTEP